MLLAPKWVEQARNLITSSSVSLNASELPDILMFQVEKLKQNMHRVLLN